MPDNTEIDELKYQIDTYNDEIAELNEAIKNKKGEIDNFQLDPDNYKYSYDQMIDDCYGDFMGYSASYILSEVDPTAYRCGMADYLDSLDMSDDPDYQELVEELEELESDLKTAESNLEELEDELLEFENED
jgi:predicted  nucleic acid-binding Zn-ribbon protein